MFVGIDKYSWAGKAAFSLTASNNLNISSFFRKFTHDEMAQEQNCLVFWTTYLLQKNKKIEVERRKVFKKFLQQCVPHRHSQSVMLIHRFNHPHLLSSTCEDNPKYYRHTQTVDSRVPLTKKILNRRALWYHCFVSVMPEALKTSLSSDKEWQQRSYWITVHLVL